MPADHVRKLGLDLGVATHVEVVNCLFEEFFDGILASGIPPAGLLTILKSITPPSSTFGATLGRWLGTSTILTFTTMCATEPVHRLMLRLRRKPIPIPARSIFTTT